jgi:protocatechuate 3,4-dioxygenase beta subunit
MDRRDPTPAGRARRRVLRTAVAVAAASLALPARTSPRRALREMTEGPFYPAAAWRRDWPDQDADLSRVRQRDGSVLAARGEHLGLQLQVVDTDGRAVDGCDVEIWQCDALALYRHPRQPLPPGGFDAGFQGFGAGRSNPEGLSAFRTIRPVAYPGRTPHIHLKLRHVNFGELTTQLFVAGDPGNARDFLWRTLAPAEQAALALRLQPAEPASGLVWQAAHTLVVPA